jgi:hypothetical protein
MMNYYYCLRSSWSIVEFLFKTSSISSFFSDTLVRIDAPAGLASTICFYLVKIRPSKEESGPPGEGVNFF